MNDLLKPLSELRAGDRETLVITPSGTIGPLASSSLTILSGAFNPLHRGHRRLLQIGQRISGSRHAMFELTLKNATKQSITNIELKQRLEQFHGWATVAVTNSPLFVDKARIFKRATFVMGTDTAQLLFSPNYYTDVQGGMTAALKILIRNDCRLLLADREIDGVFSRAADLPIPTELKDIVSTVPSSDFYEPLSSSQIRR